MEQELDLQQLWQVFKKRLNLIIILPLVAALISLLYTQFAIVPLYKTSTTLMVVRPIETSQITYQDVLVGRQLVDTYRELARSRRVIMVAIANDALPFGVEQLRGKIDVVAMRDTEIINITATDEDPATAAKIANAVTTAFIEEISDIMRVENVSLIDSAVEPLGPFSPNVRMNVLVALAVGLMAAVGLAFLIEYLDRSLKEPDQITQLLKLPVLGVIPQMEEE